MSEFKSKELLSFWSDAKKYGIEHGYTQSIHDFSGIIGIVNLAGANNNVTLQDIYKRETSISHLAQAIHSQLKPVLYPNTDCGLYERLTARETEILKWTADGKTSGEISIILGISDRTINFHLTNTISKLKVTNKTAAAAKAVLLKLI